MDGSAAYLGMINQALLSVYYYLLERLHHAGFTWEEDSNGQPVNVKISWIDNEKQVVTRREFVSVNSQVPLPIITVEDTGGTEIPFELGNSLASKGRSYVITVFAESIADRNRYVDFLENIFSDREITIYDYNAGTPASFEDNSSLPVVGFSTTTTAYTTQHDDPTDPNVIDRHIGMISFTLEVLQSV